MFVRNSKSNENQHIPTTYNNEEGCQNDFSAQDNQTYITIKNIIEICLTQK